MSSSRGDAAARLWFTAFAAYSSPAGNDGDIIYTTIATNSPMSTAMTINDSGNVGIGSTSPNYTLDVNGGTVNPSIYIGSGASLTSLNTSNPSSERPSEVGVTSVGALPRHTMLPSLGYCETPSTA